MQKNKHLPSNRTGSAKQLNKTQEIHQDSDDEEPLDAVKILISKEESAPAKTIADRFDKLTCFLFGALCFVTILNLAKFLGYQFPVLVKLNITMNWWRIRIPNLFKVYNCAETNSNLVGKFMVLQNDQWIWL